METVAEYVVQSGFRIKLNQFEEVGGDYPYILSLLGKNEFGEFCVVYSERFSSKPEAVGRFSDLCQVFADGIPNQITE